MGGAEAFSGALATPDGDCSDVVVAGEACSRGKPRCDADFLGKLSSSPLGVDTSTQFFGDGRGRFVTEELGDGLEAAALVKHIVLDIFLATLKRGTADAARGNWSS